MFLYRQAYSPANITVKSMLPRADSSTALSTTLSSLWCGLGSTDVPLCYRLNNNLLPLPDPKQQVPALLGRVGAAMHRPYESTCGAPKLFLWLVFSMARAAVE